MQAGTPEIREDFQIRTAEGNDYDRCSISI